MLVSFTRSSSTGVTRFGAYPEGTRLAPAVEGDSTIGVRQRWLLTAGGHYWVAR